MNPRQAKMARACLNLSLREVAAVVACSHQAIKKVEDGKINSTTSLVWAPSRPINYRFDPWWFRIELAWGVLTGKYDAIQWEGI